MPSDCVVVAVLSRAIGSQLLASAGHKVNVFWDAGDERDQKWIDLGLGSGFVWGGWEDVTTAI